VRAHDQKIFFAGFHVLHQNETMGDRTHKKNFIKNQLTLLYMPKDRDWRWCQKQSCIMLVQCRHEKNYLAPFLALTLILLLIF
jgi:hypothetical protein